MELDDSNLYIYKFANKIFFDLRYPTSAVILPRPRFSYMNY